MESVEIEIKSAWFSKINWTQVVGVVATVGTAFGLDVPKEELLNVLVGIQSIVAIATIVQRTWFTTKLTPASAAKV